MLTLSMEISPDVKQLLTQCPDLSGGKEQLDVPFSAFTSCLYLTRRGKNSSNYREAASVGFAAV